MTKEEMFDIWAPPSSRWSLWAKAVLFSQMEGVAAVPAPAGVDAAWVAGFRVGHAIVADLPAEQGVAFGLAAAAAGFRPVPLYNACPAPPSVAALVEVRPILAALAAGAETLRALHLPDDAPPVFLLDSQRNNPVAPPLPGAFDNRSISLPTDFPSAEFLRFHGIQGALLVQQESREPRADLAHTLLRWQEAGVAIHAVALNEPPPRPTLIAVRRPSHFRTLFYNALAKLGFVAHPLGGFGGKLPMPSSG